MKPGIMGGLADDLGRLPLLGQEPIDQPAGDTDFPRLAPQMIRREPTGILDLFLIDRNFPARIRGGKSDHKGVRKWPGLAAKRAYLFDPYPYFLQDFAFYGLFQCFSRLHKTGEDAVNPPRKMARPGHKQLVASLHQDDDRRGKAGEL